MNPLHKIWSFQLSISALNVTKSAGNFIFCAVILFRKESITDLCNNLVFFPLWKLCFPNFTFPANLCLLRVNNRNARKRCEICSVKTIVLCFTEKLPFCKCAKGQQLILWGTPQLTSCLEFCKISELLAFRTTLANA